MSIHILDIGANILELPLPYISAGVSIGGDDPCGLYDAF
jgi:hypothetical protein